MKPALILIVFALPLHAAEVTVTLGTVKAGAVIKQTHLQKLSQTTELTLWVEGPAPLEVTTPKPVLTRPNSWRTFEVGLPLREILPNGRQRWQHVYRLSPLEMHERVPIPLAPLRVRVANQQEIIIEWGDAIHYVRVESSVKNASLDSLHDPADIEQLPPPPEKPPAVFNWWFSVIPLSLLIAFLLIIFARRKVVLAIPHDAAWAIHALAKTVTPDQCVAVLRDYVGFRHGIDARTKTTAEFLACLQIDGRLRREHLCALQQLLDTCDRARFSGTQQAEEGLSEHARQWIESVDEQFRTSLTDLSKKIG